MNKDEIFRKLSGRLYHYYSEMKFLNTLETRIKVLERQEIEVERDIRTCNIKIEPESKSIDYSRDRVQTSNTGSYVENDAIRQIEKLERQLVTIRRRIFKDKARIRSIELNNAELSSAINMFDENVKTLLKLKYYYRYPNVRIGMEDSISLSESGVRKKLEETIEKIYAWQISRKS